MRFWERARSGSDACGGCVTLVKHGDPVLVVTIDGLNKRRIRCEACAGAPVNAEQLMAFDESQIDQQSVIRHPKSREFTAVQTLAKELPFDVKRAQSGERE